MPRPPQPPSTQANEALLRAAASRFASQGFAGASLNEILREAGWAKSSFYYRHENKAALHDNVVRTLAERLSEGVDVPDLNQLNAREFWAAMDNLVQQLARAAARHPETRELGLMYHRDDTALPNSELARIRTAAENWVRAFVARAAELGLVRKELSVDLATQLTFGILAAFDRWAIEHPRNDSAALNPVDLVRRVLGET